MIKINISDKALKKFADLEEECLENTAGPLAVNPEDLEEINYSWDLEKEEKEKKLE